jgi:hypothetical protein
MNLKLPLLPINLLKIRNYVIAVIAGTVAQMVYYSLNVLWPLQISTLYTTNNTLIGWMSVRGPSFKSKLEPYINAIYGIECTTGASLAFGEILAGVTFKWIGHYKWQLVVTNIGLAAFCGMMASTNQYSEGRAIAVYLSKSTTFNYATVANQNRALLLRGRLSVGLRLFAA